MFFSNYPDSKVHGAIMGPTWVLPAPDGPHAGPMNFAIRVTLNQMMVQVRKYHLGGSLKAVLNSVDMTVTSSGCLAPNTAADRSSVVLSTTPGREDGFRRPGPQEDVFH